MKKANRKIIGFVWFLSSLIFIIGMFTSSFFLTAYIYKTTGLNPPEWLVQVVNSLLGLVFAGLIVNIVARFARSKGWIPEMSVFGPIINALEKIATGDFSIRLEDDSQENQIVSILTNSVNKMALELDQIENMRQEFISNVSHEIQSPLTSIRGFAQALENDDLSLEDRHHYLSIIATESARLSRITEDLIKLAALELENPKFEPKRYWLDRQIRNLILACEPQWIEKKIGMDVSLEEIEVSADEDLLSQVWTNLIHNSIKFTPQGGKVFVKLHRQGDRIECRIRDTGIGISEEDRARIFERFFKADKSRTRPNGGSGLGLSIVKKIVEMHHGTVALESKLGEGTTFTIDLPITQ